MPEENDQEKTEEPTQRRIQEAVKKGQVATSREVANFFMFVVLALNIVWFAPFYARLAVFDLARFIHSPHDLSLDFNNLHAVTIETVLDVAFIMLLPIMATVVAALAANFLQNGLVISGEPIVPKLEKISLLKGVKRLFSMRSLVEFIKGLVKITIVGALAYLVVASEISRLAEAISYSVKDVISLLSSLAFRMVLAATAVMFIIALLDFAYQRYEYLKNLRMTRQELKDEFKQAEGDPKIKAKLKQIRMERAQKRMMAAVPDADVVIRNPTHYAVALKYDQMTMQAPMVVAMGQEKVALRIIEVAEDNAVPVVMNRPLARALYETAELDEEIPLEHYQAVAEVISYVYKLKTK